MYVPTERLSANNYAFGRLKVFMQVKNGNLTVRVGGGFMSIKEFLAQNAEAEAAWYIEQMQNIDMSADGYTVMAQPNLG